ncbi:MAG: glutamate-5-semialdehyde dehydrogenase [Alphaproteobacteria bacterium]|nr:glutamate-5-semialdehyde dehydrogenase [Alphaproteobacteria bacterium]NCQ87982.1 glutamate-5-semialdehyde dehydrogenase [Alphaproteobacteria bacterium]NCT05511.1 glutamate-5-semialdehyde dehydrogenase [Alphaproteobacteria bacterium]
MTIAAAHTQKLNIIQTLGREAKKAAFILGQAPASQINAVLKTLAVLIQSNGDDVIKANQKDVLAAKEKSLSASMIDRLVLNTDRLNAIASSVLLIKDLPDPVGRVLSTTTRPNGLEIHKVAVPIGVLGMIYESRPNVTIDAAALCLKSHNAVILRGGSESFHSSQILHSIVQQALRENDLPQACVQIVPSTDRALVSEMLAANDVIDVMIPRGGKGLTSLVMEQAKMPVFAHLDGNCHIYVHASANQNIALDIIKNAKLRRTGICGAAESLLLDSALTDTKVKEIASMLLNEGCIIVGDDRVQALDDRIMPATDDDWSMEYLDKKISAKFISDVQDAVTHINAFGSHHTDCILSEDEKAVSYFLNNVDSAIVMHNASTQFADGGEFGFGAEIGIGTGKLHARGPVGLEQLTTFKYHVLGTGQVRG